MWFETLLDTGATPGYGGLFFAAGSFGVIDGGADMTCDRASGDGCVTYTQTVGDVTLRAVFSIDESGVTVRRDTFENTSDAPMTVNAFCGRFRPDGNDYDVYTQFNGWQHESAGNWSRLVTQITAAAEGIRTCDGASPVMALHNLITDRTTVFHLLTNAQWKMNVRKFARNDGAEVTVLETGFENASLRLVVEPGETVELPTVLFFPAQNRVDLDAYKLHDYFNRNYPRKKMPVLYNSWMYCFDRLDVDDLLRQVDAAADLGIEGFMIDAGWFGNGRGWYESAGDWQENTLSGPCGRLKEIADRAHAHGMMFGLWFEPERAAMTSRAVKEHPDFFFGDGFLNFADPDARAFELGLIQPQIEKYGIDWVKFDFNNSLPEDPTGQGFYRYFKGQRAFIEALRTRFPDLYITCCASGGQRMEIGQATLSDSFWPSDNEGQLDEMRILKDTFKRMPPTAVERWNVQKFGGEFDVYNGNVNRTGFMFTCDGATWDHAVNVSDAYTAAYLCGGPIGFSCDVASIPEAYREKWKATVARFKENRAFYHGANLRILCDASGVLVLQYADPALLQIEVQVFTEKTWAPDLVIRPVVDPTLTYRLDGRSVSGRTLGEDGIRVGLPPKYGCLTFVFTAER